MTSGGNEIGRGWNRWTIASGLEWTGDVGHVPLPRSNEDAIETPWYVGLAGSGVSRACSEWLPRPRWRRRRRNSSSSALSARASVRLDAIARTRCWTNQPACATKPTTMTSSATGGSGVSPMNRITIQVATQNRTENRKPKRHIRTSCNFAGIGHAKTPLSWWTEAFSQQATTLAPDRQVQAHAVAHESRNNWQRRRRRNLFSVCSRETPFTKGAAQSEDTARFKCRWDRHAVPMAVAVEPDRCSSWCPG